MTFMRNMSSNNWDCSDAQAVAKFFTNSCVLDWYNNKELPATLYSLCKQGMYKEDI